VKLYNKRSRTHNFQLNIQILAITPEFSSKLPQTMQTERNLTDRERSVPGESQARRKRGGRRARRDARANRLSSLQSFPHFLSS